MAGSRQPKKPRRGFDDLAQDGLKTYTLADAHRPKVEPRLPAGTLEGLKADTEALAGLQVAPATRQMQAVAATATQNQALAMAVLMIVGVRGAVLKSGAGADVRKGYGLSTRLNGQVVKSVVAAGEVIVERVATSPEEARGLGILDTDVQTIKALLGTVTNADQAQEALIAAKPMSTGERNRVARRIVDAVRRISGAGILAFALDPVLRDQFDALDEGPAVKKKASKAT